MLIERGYEVDYPSSSTCNLLTDEGVKRFYSVTCDAVINLAAVCGGIQANADAPGEFFYKNLKMGMSLIEGARVKGIKKFVQLGSVCSYPRDCPIPFKEDDLFNGEMDWSNRPYGAAKQALIQMSFAYNRQYGMNIINPICINMYGAHDNFNERTSHVIPGLIRKFVTAKQNNDPFVKCRGKGIATREFLHVQDACQGIIQALEYYDDVAPVNLKGGNIWSDDHQAGSEIKISHLAEIIKDLVGYEGGIIYDGVSDEGQPRRSLDGTLAKQLFGYSPKISLHDGLKETIDWYISNADGLRS
jgi:GDP-L-fucose synthase